MARSCDYCEEGLPAAVTADGRRIHSRVHEDGVDQMPCMLNSAYWPEKRPVSVKPHEHRWQGIDVERGVPLTYVIQSCECGVVRRVVVPD